MIGVLLGGGLAGVPAAAAAPETVRWKPCPARDSVEGAALKGLECATLTVPLDHDRPSGRKISLALTRARHTSRVYRGAMLLNRGGPGAHGRDLPAIFARAMPGKLAASYDWIGFDARGVGASKPSLICDPTYLDPGRPRPDTVPRNQAAIRGWKQRAQRFADDCADKHHSLLRFMGTDSWVRDMEAIRIALGRRRINYFGYSYGAYLGAAYATAYPHRVRRMVLDSVVRPSGVWYGNNLDQNVAFEKRILAYFGWIARYHDVFGLGRTAREVETAYYKARKSLAAKPLRGRVGPVELDDVFLNDGYSTHAWAGHAKALADYLLRNDPKALAEQWERPSRLDQNNYAMYNAVQCRDAAWPRDWSVWLADSRRLYQSGNRFETWNNTWYNAPCAFWGLRGGPPPMVGGGAATPPILLVQAGEDAATPYQGAVETHRLFPTSRLVVQRDGGTHGVSMGGDRCVDRAVHAYLRRGTLPPDRKGPDVSCKAAAPPAPSPARRSDRDRPLARVTVTHPWTR